LEDEIQPDGSLHRRHKSEVLGTLKDFPTKRLAQRELDIRLAVVNTTTYRASPTALFTDFAERWKVKVMCNHKPSSQSSERSDIKAWVNVIGDYSMKNISAELVQTVVSAWKSTRSAKTIRNRVATFRLLWASAKAWSYVAHDPCEALSLPDWTRSEQPTFSVEEVQRIIAASKPPYDVVFWLVAETGIRRGEVCALNVGHVDLENRIITVKQSMWNRQITTTKADKPRKFALSSQLTQRLKFFVDGRSVEEPLFLTKQGKRLHPDNFVKRHLKPILKALGLHGALHAFRHGNATALDILPMKVRQERLGHVSPNTTMAYTHFVSEDDRKIAEGLGRFFAQVCPDLPKNVNGSGATISQAV
jgi:integrase